MSLSAGRMLSHYRLVEQIGEGGMGVVWRATDTTLDREVAIKVLPEGFSEDVERMVRFEREARILASLNHPHIASIYGLGSSDGVRFLALELVAGDDLAARLAQRPLPVVEALDVARQIAEALESAHEKGIIHRDLKPANVKVTPDGQVKVLDFGLAKALEDPVSNAASPSQSHSPTLTSPMTAAHVILGTAAYMSPEQARGKEVDRRADIWAFGCVLYECLTGRRAFGGETVSDTLAKIIEREPDLSLLPGGMPPRVREVLQRCMTKDPKLRLRDIGDGRIALEEILAARSASGRLLAVEPSAAPARPRRDGRLLIATALGLVIGGALWSLVGPGVGGRVAHEPRCLSLTIPDGLRVQTQALTRDGRSLIVLATTRSPDGSQAPNDRRLYLRPLDRYEFKPIPGTEGALGFAIDLDGRHLLFAAPVAPGAIERRLAYVPLDGGAPPTTITEWKEGWNQIVELHNGDLLIGAGPASFVRLPKGSANLSAPVTIDAGRPGVSSYGLLGEALPGDRGLLVNLVSYDARGWHYSVGVMDPKNGKVRVIEEDGGNAVYLPTGHLVFARGDAVLAVRFDARGLETRGSPVAVWNGLATAFTFTPAGFDVRGGTLFYVPGQIGGDRPLAYLDAAGKLTPWSTERWALDGAPVPSPDGRRFACSIANARGIDEIWLSDMARPGLRRLGTDPNADCYWPVWTPDGKRITYRRRGGDGRDGIYIQDAAGGEAERILKAESSEVQTATSWRPDGSELAGFRNAGGRNDLWMLPFRGGIPDTSRLRRILPSAFNQFNPRISGDGRLLSYGSNESGTALCYVAELEPGGGIGAPVAIKTAGFAGQVWAPNGRTLYIADQRQRVMKVNVTLAPELSISAPTELYDFEKLGVSVWSVLPDGRHFVGLKNDNEKDITRYNLVLDWTDELKRIVR